MRVERECSIAVFISTVITAANLARRMNGKFSQASGKETVLFAKIGAF